MRLSRRNLLGLLGSAALLPSCGSSQNVIRVGSKNFAENVTIAEIYAYALELANFKVVRRMNLGSTQIAMAALEHGDIDLYPEYTGTGLIDVLHMPPMHDPKAILGTLQRQYAHRFDATWLEPAPANDSQGLAVTKEVSRKFGLTTLSQCAHLAPQLRLAAIPEFVTRADALPGLQKFYGGFHFSSVRTFDIGLQYNALAGNAADVATAFTTDAQIAAQSLVVLQDDRHFWPPYNIAPVVRLDALAHGRYAAIVNQLTIVSSQLTDYAVRRLNLEVQIRKRDPADVANEFMLGFRGAQ